MVLGRSTQYTGAFVGQRLHRQRNAHAALSLICDEAGFLLDEKANDLIESVPVSEQGYVRAEEVVRALGVRDASALKHLSKRSPLTTGRGTKREVIQTAKTITVVDQVQYLTY